MSYAKNYFTANLNHTGTERWTEKKSKKIKKNKNLNIIQVIQPAQLNSRYRVLIHHQEYQMSRVRTLNMTGPGQPIPLFFVNCEKAN